MSYTVDYVELRNLGTRLQGLKEEFDGAEATMDGYEAAIDHGGLSGELDSFATNWSDKKEEVGGRIDEVSGMAVGAADCYSGADEQLCDQIQGP